MGDELEELTLSEFNKKYNEPKEDWQFDLFKIVCVKCGSSDVEYKGKMETDYGYYGSFDVSHMLVVKCHGCGNAFAMKNTEGGSSDYCSCDN